ncbi:MAG: undecaprenyl-diphosphate phosphatase [Candidatus Micrarchaeia archaeon]|jgi:undecaprenyl-diphosphatase
MDILTIIALGLVQGIAEWVPISSKTQVTATWLSLFGGDPAAVMPILLYVHIGTVLAAMIYFRKEISQMLSSILKKPLEISTYQKGETGFLVTAIAFTGLLGFPLLLLEKTFFPTLNASALFGVMGAGLMLTGFLLDSQKGRPAERKKESVTWKDGILTGILQGLSVLPGVSRSGTSTTGLIWRGFDSENSFHLSFLLSIPTVVCAELVLYLGGAAFSFPIADGLLLALSSFVFGYITIDALLKAVKRISVAKIAYFLGAIMIAAWMLGAA